MTIEQLIENTKQLRLFGIAETIEQRLMQARDKVLSYEEVLSMLYSGEFFRTAFSQKIDVKLSKIFSILTLPKYTSAGVLYPKL